MRYLLFAPLCVALWLLCLSAMANADCCKPSKILFKLAYNNHSFTCDTFGGKYHNNETCEKKICGNGDPVKGTWCGRGRCNPRGCHCKNGCLPGEAVSSFREKHGFFNFEYVGYA